MKLRAALSTASSVSAVNLRTLNKFSSKIAGYQVMNTLMNH